MGVAGGRSDRGRFTGAEAWAAWDATVVQVALKPKHLDAITAFSRC